jgi:hypothetical protein
VFTVIAPVHGQLFGARQFGQPLRRQLGASVFAPAGKVLGSERFVRGNRSRADFVGADRREVQSFVGSEQARTSGAVISALAGLRAQPDRSGTINRPLQMPKSDQMYHPTLQVAFQVPSPSAAEKGNRLTKELSDAVCFSRRCRFEVSVVARKAILRGAVADEEERDLAELLVLFEPGISAVQNELQLLTPARPLSEPIGAAGPHNSGTPLRRLAAPRVVQGRAR